MIEYRAIYWMMCEADSKESDLTFSISDWLSGREQIHLQSLRFEKRRWEWMLGRMTCKRLIQQAEPACLQTSGSKIEIINEEEGAPYAVFSGDRLLGSLTLSHRGGMAVAAYTSDPDLSIGVDLEMIEPRAESFLEDFFTSEEVRAAHRENGTQKDLWVTIAWSVKESVLKALRKGLRLDTRSVEIGKVDEIEDWENQMGEWRSVELKQVSGEILGWRAWWRNHHGFVQTLALLDQQKGSPQVTLHELPAAIFRLPDPKEWMK